MQMRQNVCECADDNWGMIRVVEKRKNWEAGGMQIRHSGIITFPQVGTFSPSPSLLFNLQYEACRAAHRRVLLLGQIEFQSFPFLNFGGILRIQLLTRVSAATPPLFECHVTCQLLRDTLRTAKGMQIIKWLSAVLTKNSLSHKST